MANFVQRFGRVKSVTSMMSPTSGKPFLRLAIDAGKFTVYVSVFKQELVAMLGDAPIGERIWVKGPIDSNTLEVNGEMKTYKNLVAQFARLGARPAAHAQDANTQDANTQDANTQPEDARTEFDCDPAAILAASIEAAGFASDSCSVLDELEATYG